MAAAASAWPHYLRCLLATAGAAAASNTLLLPLLLG
jgi:hypothetical protein